MNQISVGNHFCAMGTSLDSCDDDTSDFLLIFINLWGTFLLPAPLKKLGNQDLSKINEKIRLPENIAKEKYLNFSIVVGLSAEVKTPIDLKMTSLELSARPNIGAIHGSSEDNAESGRQLCTSCQ